MNHIVISVLLIIVGLILGLAVSFIINLIRGNLTSKKLEELVNKTKKEIEKMKRDAALEQKEEAHRLKMDLDKEIREKKEEIKESENTQPINLYQDMFMRFKYLLEWCMFYYEQTYMCD